MQAIDLIKQEMRDAYNESIVLNKFGKRIENGTYAHFRDYHKEQ